MKGSLNYLGSERYRLYRMAFLSQSYPKAEAKERGLIKGYLLEEINDFETILHALREGAGEFLLPQVTHPMVRDRLEAHLRDWLRIKRDIEAILTAR